MANVVIDYDLFIENLREIVMDLNPVSCFTVTKQGFHLSANSEGMTLTSDSNDPVVLLYEDNAKFYALMNKFRKASITLGFSLDYVPTERTKYIEPFDDADIKDGKTVTRDNYFSKEIIDEVVIDYFTVFYPEEVVDTSVPDAEELFSECLSYMDFQHLMLWCAYFLIERKRKNYAENKFILENQGGFCDSDLRNFTQQIATTVGDSFRVTETESIGRNEEGFTALWGDKYEYLSKYQLYIRSRFETLFNDFSLRDNSARSQSTQLVKHWSKFAYVDTKNLTEITRDILSPFNELSK